MLKCRSFVQRRKVSATVAALFAVFAATFAVLRWSESALATSGGNPYTVTVVTDTNPDPTIVETTIVAAGTTEDIGNGLMANLLTFNGTLPGPEFRLNVGDTVIVHYQNNLGHASGIHWHGIELANASDGTPLTQNMVPPGGTFLYKFKVPRPGIYWYHPHHHSSTNQVFKGLYGSIIVTDPNEAALVTSGTLPPANQTLTMVLSDLTVCKAVGSNDAATYAPTLPHVSGGALPVQFGPTPQTVCELTPIDEDGNPRAAYAAGDVPNIQIPGSAGAVNEGQTVVTNGQNVGGRAGTPAAPGALAPGASKYAVNAGQGLRLQLISTTVTRFFRLRLTDQSGTQIPLVRVGGQGGLLDHARVEGGVVSGFDFNYGTGEILVDPGDRADVVVAIPASALVGDVLTLWTQDFARTGGGFTNTPTVPVAHFEVTNGPGAVFTIAGGTPLRAATGDPVEVLGAATGTLLDPAVFSPVKAGLSSQDIKLTNVPGTSLGINGVQGVHDAAEPYSGAAHVGSTRYAKLGDTLQLTVTNQTGAHHPFHLHGFSIQPLTLTRPANPTYTFPYAEFKDNVDVPGNYTLTFRVRLDDRALMDGTTLGGGLGRWVFHCHIFFHASFGMISEFDVVAPNGNERPYVNANNTRLTGFTGDTFTMQGTYHDPDGNPVTLTASAGTMTDNGGGQWTWTQTGPSSGLVYVSATDSNGLKDQTPFDVTVNPPSSQISGIKTVTGTFRPGGAITYSVVLTNGGVGTQANNPGNEFSDVLPASLTLVSASATSGAAVATVGTNTVTWNGSLAAGASVTITISATITASTAGGTVVTNQGVANSDRDGNGTNEFSALTDDPGVAGAANPTSLTVSSPASITATKTVAGAFHPGNAITYTVVLTNAGPSMQFDNPGSEFTDVLPASLVLTSASATSGAAVATIATRTVTWNGSLAAGASVTITINATIAAATAPGTLVTNQGTVSFDADGNGTNEAAVLTDDPAAAGAANPTSFRTNTAPTVTPIVDASIPVNTSHSVLFNIGDDSTVLAALTVVASSSNASLVPPGGLAILGAGAIRTLTVTPLPNQTGQTMITVSVGDGALTTGRSFTLSVVTPVNQAPAISGLAPATIEENATAIVNFTIADDTTAAAALVVSATSSNPALLPPGGVVVGGSGAARTLSLTPNEEQTGQTTVTVSVSDGSLTTTMPIVVTVAAAAPPQPPTTLAASVSLTTVSFTWVRPAGAVPTFYVIEGGTAPGLSTLPVINTQSRATAWTLSLPSGTYFFRVRGGNRAGTSAVSNEVVVQVATTAGLPGPPIGLVTGVTDSQVTLNWRPSALGGAASQWQLEIATLSAGSVVSTFVLPASLLSATGTLAPGDYAARVFGINSAGMGPASNEARFHVGALPGCIFPDPPVLLPAAVTGRAVTLSWRSPRNAAIANYRLLVGSTPGGADLAIFDVGAVTAFVADGGPGIYYMALLATNACGTSNPSNSIEVAVGTANAPPAAPTNVQASVDGHRVTIRWSAVAGAASYLVEAGSAPGTSDLAAQPVVAPLLVAEGVPSGIYYVRVRAVGAGGAGAPSIEVIVIVP